MLFTLFSVALFVAASIRGVSAAFAINSPQLVQVRCHCPRRVEEQLLTRANLV